MAIGNVIGRPVFGVQRSWPGQFDYWGDGFRMNLAFQWPLRLFPDNDATIWYPKGCTHLGIWFGVLKGAVILLCEEKYA
jgi:hypothetical protein